MARTCPEQENACRSSPHQQGSQAVSPGTMCGMPRVVMKSTMMRSGSFQGSLEAVQEMEDHQLPVRRGPEAVLMHSG